MDEVKLNLINWDYSGELKRANNTLTDNSTDRQYIDRQQHRHTAALTHNSTDRQQHRHTTALTDNSTAGSFNTNILAKAQISTVCLNCRLIYINIHAQYKCNSAFIVLLIIRTF